MKKNKNTRVRLLQKRAYIRISLLLILVLFFYPAITNAAPSTKIDFLIRFYDMNESAFAHHRHCLSTKEPINPTFLKTLEFVADELFAESKKDNPKINPEYIKNKILERRYNIQYRLDHANMKEGCYSQASLVAKEHYQEFSNYNTSQIRKFIDEQTND